jgi:cysteine desulfurase family protein
MIYLDNAATSWPKPETVYAAADDGLRQAANPGRASHAMSIRAERIVEQTRASLALLIGAEARQVIWTQNATEALNLALKGLLKTGDHVITSSLEHNAVARPLEGLRRTGVEVEKIATDPVSGVSLPALEQAIRPGTRLIVLSHASNVLGTINPIAAIGRIARQQNIPLLVDAAQTAGCLPLDVKAMAISLLAMTGHKSLFGPQGTGVLYIEKGLELRPLIEGGTGSFSAQLDQPAQLPDRYESGTLNLPGIAGLGAGLRFIADTGLAKIHAREQALVQQLLASLARHPKITTYGPPPGRERAAVVSLTIAGWDSQTIAAVLDDSFQIAVRAGLHCAPDAHRLIGTLPGGAVRLSPGYFTTAAEIEAVIEAITTIADS